MQNVNLLPSAAKTEVDPAGRESRDILKGMRNAVGVLALALAPTVMAGTVPSDAEALPTANSATTVPNAKNAFAEAPVISDDDIRKTLREQPRTFMDVADPEGNKVNFAILDSADSQYMVLSVTPTVKNEAGVTHEFVAVIGTADGHYLQVVPETSSVAKWETFGSASGSYNLARSTIALPISSLGDGKGLNGLTGSTLYAGFTKNGDINALLRDKVYGKLKYFEKTSSSAPAASDSVNMMPGAEVLSAPIKMSSIPALKDIKYPAKISAYGDALLQINGGEWVKDGAVNADDLVVAKGKSATLSNIKAEFGFMVNGEHKVKTEVQTEPYKTLTPTNLPADGAVLDIPFMFNFSEGTATLERKSSTESGGAVPYTSGTRVAPLVEHGTYATLVYTNGKGETTTKMIDLAPICNVPKIPDVITKLGEVTTFTVVAPALKAYNFSTFSSVSKALGAGNDGVVSTSSDGEVIRLTQYDASTYTMTFTASGAKTAGDHQHTMTLTSLVTGNKSNRTFKTIAK